GMTRDNALFLSTAAQFNVSGAILIKNWFVNKFNILSGINDNTLNYTAIQYLKNPNMRSRILDFIKLIDIGIQDISVTENIIESFSESRMIPDDPLIQKILGSISDSMVSSGGKIKELDILSSHNKYEGEKIVEKTYLPFRNESIGTIKIFALLGPWLETLHKGGVLVIDDFGSSIHTKLALELMRLFQSKLNNGEAQLIVTTHDTNLLRKDVLRRDQIWFVEKDAKGVSDVYSLLEYRVNQASCVRNDASFSKDYLLGKYGAIPYFGNIEKFISDYSTNED
ncbi:MAG: ATP-binding protein, partial [Bacteroidales bacterium]|nr:ATP-binding protein [Bacteroidales bacterium]